MLEFKNRIKIRRKGATVYVQIMHMEEKLRGNFRIEGESGFLICSSLYESVPRFGLTYNDLFFLIGFNIEGDNNIVNKTFPSEITAIKFVNKFKNTIEKYKQELNGF